MITHSVASPTSFSLSFMCVCFLFFFVLFLSFFVSITFDYRCDFIKLIDRCPSLSLSLYLCPFSFFILLPFFVFTFSFSLFVIFSSHSSSFFFFLSIQRIIITITCSQKRLFSKLTNPITFHLVIIYATSILIELPHLVPLHCPLIDSRWTLLQQ